MCVGGDMALHENVWDHVQNLAAYLASFRSSIVVGVSLCF